MKSFLRFLTSGIVALQRETLEPRFFAKVVKTDGCWRWTASIDPSTGYGQMTITTSQFKVKVRSHRLAWLLFRGDIPAGKRVLHSCDNRACVNPEHLFIGTARDNTIDMCRKKRLGSNRITFETAQEIRGIYSAGGVSQPQLARRFGLAQSSIGRLLLNQTWRPEVHA
jgi:hypothetical protein